VGSTKAAAAARLLEAADRIPISLGADLMALTVLCRMRCRFFRLEVVSKG